MQVLRVETVRVKSSPTRLRLLVWGIRGSSQLSCCLPMLVQSSTRAGGCFCTVVERMWAVIFCLVRSTRVQRLGSRLIRCQALLTLKMSRCFLI